MVTSLLLRTVLDKLLHCIASRCQEHLCTHLWTHLCTHTHTHTHYQSNTTDTVLRCVGYEYLASNCVCIRIRIRIRIRVCILRASNKKDETIWHCNTKQTDRTHFQYAPQYWWIDGLWYYTDTTYRIATYRNETQRNPSMVCYKNPLVWWIGMLLPHGYVQVQVLYTVINTYGTPCIESTKTAVD